MTKFSYRNVQVFLSLITLLVFSASLYFQYGLGLSPCPLCLMQRLCVFILLFFCLMGVRLSTLKRARAVSFAQLFFALAGLYFSARQLWLQTLPPESAPACVPGLDVLIKYFPWQDVAHALFWGSGDCAEQSWSLLGLSMPAWALFYFLFMAMAGFLLSRSH